jgi:hypothetical protein
MFASANTSPDSFSINHPLDIRSAIRIYMEPLLKKNNFVFSHSENFTHIFRHIKNTGLFISFTAKPEDKCIRCDLNRGNKKDLLATYPLSLFVHGDSCAKVTKNDGFWHYHSDEELIAILEEQAELLAEFGFQWLFDYLHVELEEC